MGFPGLLLAAKDAAAGSKTDRGPDVGRCPLNT